MILLGLGGFFAAMTFASLALVNELDKRKRQAARTKQIEQIDKVYDWHPYYGPCALCGEYNHLTVSADPNGKRLFWSCIRCGGNYPTSTKSIARDL